MKTKLKIFGNPKRSKLFRNQMAIAEVINYKVWVILSAQLHYPIKIRSKVHTSFWATKHCKLYSTVQGHVYRGIPPNIMFNMFDALMASMFGKLVHNFDVKLTGLLQHTGHILRVKVTTNNMITIEQCSRFPPSTVYQISALCFVNRLHNVKK